MRSVNVYIHFSVARDTAWEQRKHGAEDEIDALHSFESSFKLLQ
mgnify:CR=1 FL=1